MKRCVPLEAAAEAVCNQSSVPPLIFQLPPEQGRKVLEEAQNAPVYKYPANISSDCIHTGIWGSIPVYFIAPENQKYYILYSWCRLGIWQLSHSREVGSRTFGKDKFVGRIS